MFGHNFKYSLKVLLRNRMLIFWAILFPIILGVLFNMAFRDIEKNEALDIINIGIVNNEEFLEERLMVEAFKTLSDKNSDAYLYDIKYTSLSEAEELLENKKIVGYLVIEDGKERVVIKENGINETIFKNTVSDIKLKEKVLLETGDYTILSNKSNIKDISNKNMSYTMIEYYTLIAMACLYGAILSGYLLNKNLANMSSNGKRMAMAPMSKLKLILSLALASYLVIILGVFLLLLFTILFLKVDYGDNILGVILLILLGSLAGEAIGLFISAYFKTNENTKTGIVIAYTMFNSFLAGMMGITMKYIIDKNIPILNIINPVNMITDGFYALYYYNTIDRYIFNLVSLLIFSSALIIMAVIRLRSQKYDSI